MSQKNMQAYKNIIKTNDCIGKLRKILKVSKSTQSGEGLIINYGNQPVAFLRSFSTNLHVQESLIETLEGIYLEGANTEGLASNIVYYIQDQQELTKEINEIIKDTFQVYYPELRNIQNLTITPDVIYSDNTTLKIKIDAAIRDTF